MSARYVSTALACLAFTLLMQVGCTSVRQGPKARIAPESIRAISAFYNTHARGSWFLDIDASGRAHLTVIGDPNETSFTLPQSTVDSLLRSVADAGIEEDPVSFGRGYIDGVWRGVRVTYEQDGRPYQREVAIYEIANDIPSTPAERRLLTRRLRLWILLRGLFKHDGAGDDREFVEGVLRQVET